MPNRQERRQLKKAGLAFTPKQEALINEAIRVNYERGMDCGKKQAVKTCYAATCLALREEFGFSPEDVWRGLRAMDQNVVNALASEEEIDRVLKEVGIQITFSDPFSNIEEVEPEPAL